MALLHATCVAVDGVGVLIRGRPGAGKSDLALRLIDGGAELVADDSCETHTRDERLFVTPPATIAGKFEVRGFGIVELPTRAGAPIGLVVDLKPEAEIERLPEHATCDIDGVAVPLLTVDGLSASAPAKVRMALRSVRLIP
jgi:HPr kinase/phosphorylase